MRRPRVMRWPGQDELGSMPDLLPTLAHLAGAAGPAQPIDGHDLRGLILSEPGARSPWNDEGCCFHRPGQLQAVRAGPGKLCLGLPDKLVNNAGKTAAVPLQLFDVRHDVGEEHEVPTRQPEVGCRLLPLADRARVELGDGARSAAASARPGAWQGRPRGYRPSSPRRNRGIADPGLDSPRVGVAAGAARPSRQRTHASPAWADGSTARADVRCPKVRAEGLPWKTHCPAPRRSFYLG